MFVYWLAGLPLLRACDAALSGGVGVNAHRKRRTLRQFYDHGKASLGALDPLCSFVDLYPVDEKIIADGKQITAELLKCLDCPPWASALTRALAFLVGPCAAPMIYGGCRYSTR